MYTHHINIFTASTSSSAHFLSLSHADAITCCIIDVLCEGKKKFRYNSLIKNYFVGLQTSLQ